MWAGVFAMHDDPLNMSFLISPRDGEWGTSGLYATCADRDITLESVFKNRSWLSNVYRAVIMLEEYLIWGQKEEALL